MTCLKNTPHNIDNNDKFFVFEGGAMRNWIMGSIAVVGIVTSGVGIYLLATTGDSKDSIIGGLIIILLAYEVIGCDKKEGNNK